MALKGTFKEKDFITLKVKNLKLILRMSCDVLFKIQINFCCGTSSRPMHSLHWYDKKSRNLYGVENICIDYTDRH